MIAIIEIVVIIIVITIILIKQSKRGKTSDSNRMKKVVRFMTPIDDAQLSSNSFNEKILNSNSDKEHGDLSKIIENYQDKMGKGNVKVTRNVNKKIVKYINGEKVSEEETTTSDLINKQAIKECPNCGAGLETNQDRCLYCRTKIN